MQLNYPCKSKNKKKNGRLIKSNVEHLFHLKFKLNFETSFSPYILD